VALSERSLATTVNPAGLAFSQGFELSYFGNKDSYRLNLYSGTLGVSWDKGSNSYYVADGIKLAENAYLGLGLKYAKDSGYGYYGGILLRPADFLSCGYTYDNSKNYRFGLATKPFKEYVKAYVDVTNGKHFEGGIELEPVRGINLYARHLIKMEDLLLVSKLALGISYSLDREKIIKPLMVPYYRSTLTLRP